jgi:cyclopropane fatty-acyl-phospholipid synthase-like methyltransferase
VGIRTKVLSRSIFYRAFASVVSRFGTSRMDLYAKYLPYTPGLKILDLGCGPGTSTRFFRKEDYLGIDIDKDYIDSARSKHPDHQFECLDFTCFSNDSALVPKGGFDLILAYGLMHHLDDALCSAFFRTSHNVLRAKGHIVCFDGCVYRNQSRLKKKIILSDRGKHIRSPSDLTNIAEKAGFKCNSNIEEKSLSIPYSLLALSCTCMK